MLGHTPEKGLMKKNMKAFLSLLLAVVLLVSAIPVVAEELNPSEPEAVESPLEPTPEPTVKPTVEPTLEHTMEPTAEPTIEPTVEPAIEPTAEPSVEPTAAPAPTPSASPKSLRSAKIAEDQNGDGYHDGDVAVINGIIENNGLSNYTINEPDNWYFVTWSSDNTVKHVVELSIDHQGLTGKLVLSGLKSLTNLNCRNNYLTSLDLFDLDSLTYLDCSDNELASLNLNNISALSYVNCYNNQLTKLDLRKQAQLQSLSCAENPLSFLAVPNGKTAKVAVVGDGRIMLTDFYYNLQGSIKGTYRKEIGEEFTSTWKIIAGGQETEEGMLEFDLKQESLNAQAEFVKNPEILYDAGDISVINRIIENDNLLRYQKDEPASWDFVTWSTGESPVRITGLDLDNKSLSGELTLNDLTALETLDCSSNQLTSLNLSSLPSLKKLSCMSNRLTSLILSGLTSLETLYCSNNQLTTLSVNNLPLLADLDCPNNQLSILDLRDLPSLVTANCMGNQLTSLQVQGLTKLSYLRCKGNRLTELDLNALPALIEVDCSENKLQTFSISGPSTLQNLYCENNGMTTLTLENLSSLEHLECGDNQLTALNMNGLTALTRLICENNQLASINLTGLPSLLKLDCDGNRLTTMDLRDLTKLRGVDCSNNQLTSLNLSHLTSLFTIVCNNNRLTSLDTSTLSSLGLLHCENNRLTSLNVSKLPKFSDLFCKGNPLSTILLPKGKRLSVTAGTGGTVYLEEFVYREFEDDKKLKGTYVAKPNSGYRFQGWSAVSGGRINSSGKLIFDSFKGNVKANATFLKAPLTSFTLNKSSLTVAKGKTYSLKVSAYTPANTDSSKTAKWSSSNTKIATVSSGGTIKGVSTGAATITCTIAGISKTCKVTVGIPLRSFSLNKTNLTVEKGKIYTLKVLSYSPSNTTSSKTASWKSSNTKIATCGPQGRGKGNCSRLCHHHLYCRRNQQDLQGHGEYSYDLLLAEQNKPDCGEGKDLRA